MRAAAVAALLIVAASAKAIPSADETVFVAVNEDTSPVGPAKNPGDVNIRANLNVNGSVSAKEVTTGAVKVRGDAEIGTVTSSRVTATLVSADVVETGILRSASGTITIDANLALSTSSPAATSFLATDVVVDGVRQWRMVYHEDFQNGAEGWSNPATSTCGGDSKDAFLGGHCNFGRTVVTKTFAGLPPHSQVRVLARVHFLDAWNDEAAYLKLGDRYVWADTCTPGPAGFHGLNLCGGDAADRKFATPVDVSVAHADQELTLTFGSTQENEDACAQSWGVDDVMVYVR